MTVMTKRERVEAALRHAPLDRAPVLEQLSYNPRVIADWTGRRVTGFDYTLDDICAVIRQTCDLAMPPVAPRGAARETTDDGFVIQHDNWTSWHVSRPFTDADGAGAWLRARCTALRESSFDPLRVNTEYTGAMRALQAKIGETVILNYSGTGFCGVFDAMGLELFTYFMEDAPEVMADFMTLSTAREVARVHAVADPALSPVILLPEDFATKQGPLFSPAFLAMYHYPFVRRLTEAWHEHGITVIYHSDGNYRKAIPDLIACDVDGFYCLEPNCGMDIVDLKRTWPEMVWAGGVDGVDLLERGTPAEVAAEVARHIRETQTLATGGIFVASSSEINPPIPPENFRAMVTAAWETT
jgi:hypothetical protein